MCCTSARLFSILAPPPYVADGAVWWCWLVRGVGANMNVGICEHIDFAYLHEQVLLLGNCHRTSWSYPVCHEPRPTDRHCNCIGAHSSVPLLIRDAENEILNQLLRQIEPQRHLVSSFACLHIHRTLFQVPRYATAMNVLNFRENCRHKVAWQQGHTGRVCQEGAHSIFAL